MSVKLKEKLQKFIQYNYVERNKRDLLGSKKI
jgi:hypothetical protein